MEKTENLNCLPELLLPWYEAGHRDLPWRKTRDPYRIWVSEIMLQQTRAEAVRDYYTRFLTVLPTVEALAACEEEVLQKLWEGLGYYSRVRNLKKAAQVVCDQYGGQLPADYNALLKLPGIGAYTAGAVASISFGIPVPAVDGNVLRVLSRLDDDRRCVTDPPVKKDLTARVMELQPADKAGDFNQALMELGALVCLPNGAPLCESCPWGRVCKARAAGTALQLPVKARPKARRLVPVGVALVQSPEGWLLQRRPDTGLLAGLWQPPLWEDAAFADAAAMQKALADRGIDTAAVWGQTALARPLPKAKHIFTHLEWHMSGWQFFAPAQSLPEGYVWATKKQLEQAYALPGAFKVYKKQMLDEKEV